jgi:2-hydroxy-6-oxonona-2,4-dienedioate hydrolase
MASVAPASVIPLAPSSRPTLVPATRYEQRDATVLGDLRLRYVDIRPEREEGPPLVLLHGLASRIEEYEDLIPGLCARRRIIAMDLPGNGYSDKPMRPYTLTFLEDAVLGLLDGLGVGQVDLAGGSLGGNLTLRLGHRGGDRFRRLAPWAPAGAWDPMPLLGWLGGALQRAARRLFWPTVWVQSRFWYHAAWPGRRRAIAHAFAHFREVLNPGFLRMYFELAAEQVKTSLFPIAPRIEQRTMVLWGDADHGLGMGRGVMRLVALLPDARLSILRGRRHAIANEAPDEVARRVDVFLGE